MQSGDGWTSRFSGLSLVVHLMRFKGKRFSMFTTKCCLGILCVVKLKNVVHILIHSMGFAANVACGRSSTLTTMFAFSKLIDQLNSIYSQIVFLASVFSMDTMLTPAHQINQGSSPSTDSSRGVATTKPWIQQVHASRASSLDTVIGRNSKQCQLCNANERSAFFPEKQLWSLDQLLEDHL